MQRTVQSTLLTIIAAFGLCALGWRNNAANDPPGPRMTDIGETPAQIHELAKSLAGLEPDTMRNAIILLGRPRGKSARDS